MSMITDAEIADLASRGYVAVLSKTVTLTDAQIKTLPTVAVELVAAPGVGKAIAPLHAILIARIGTGAGYVLGGDDYGSIGTGVDDRELMSLIDQQVFTSSPPPAVIYQLLPSVSQTAESDPRFPYLMAKTSLGLLAAFDNAPLTISASASGNWTGGDPANTIKITLLYTIVDVS